MNLQHIAAQLRRPSGIEAPEVARRMNEANGPVNRRCIERLQLCAGDRVLEIGPGNGAFVAEIVGAADGITYTGLDWSAEMVREAQAGNRELVAAGRVQLHQGSSEAMPFADASFDKALAVHTLYFWEHPGDHLAEIRRVLRPGGLLCIAFGDRAFMQDLPFTRYGFTLYDADGGRGLLDQSGFDVRDVLPHREAGRSNTGEVVDKLIHIALAAAR